MITPPTGQTVFRAMSVVQDDLDRTKYMLYRTITLLMVYVFPFLVGLWWIAEPFVGLVYGEKWLPAVEPLRILLLAAIMRTIWIPCGVTLNAQNRLTAMIIGEALGLAISIILVVVGLRWGLAGVAWAVVASTFFYAAYSYTIVYRTIRTRLRDLLNAAAPALVLNTFLFLVLALAHWGSGLHPTEHPAAYLLVMAAIGGMTYALALLFFPIPALRSEADRWKQLIASIVSTVRVRQ
jgi:O-antigen/teichoic acid export membrane protein